MLLMISCKVCGTGWRIEKLEPVRKPDAKPSWEARLLGGLGHTHGSGKGGGAKVSEREGKLA